ncbi:MAG: hypothetical protein ABI665_16180 [Vicinamibacterales bacterium]
MTTTGKTTSETVAGLIDAAGDQLRHFSEHVRQRGTAGLMNDAAALGRRRPALFIGGAFLLGLGVARILKSSAMRAS